MRADLWLKLEWQMRKFFWLLATLCLGIYILACISTHIVAHAVGRPSWLLDSVQFLAMWAAPVILGFMVGLALLITLLENPHSPIDLILATPLSVAVGFLVFVSAISHLSDWSYSLDHVPQKFFWILSAGETFGLVVGVLLVCLSGFMIFRHWRKEAKGRMQSAGQKF
jgi:NhaP-type Na+/H+ or K+/H+ antiporter